MTQPDNISLPKSTVDAVRDALSCALAEWQDHNGKLVDKTHPHWSNKAAAALALLDKDLK